MPQPETIALLKQQIGQITPKVTASAAIFAEDGKMLLVNRFDGYGWGLPGGFCEVYEGPEETAV